LKEYAQGRGAETRREHYLDSLPVVTMGLLIGSAYLLVESVVIALIITPEFSLFFTVGEQLAYCLVILAATLRIQWPTEGYRTRVVLAVKHLRFYFSSGFRVKEFIPNFVVTGLYLYLVFWCGYFTAYFSYRLAWMLADNIFKILFNESMAKSIGCLLIKMPFPGMSDLLWTTYLIVWQGLADVQRSLVKMSIFVFLLLGTFWAVTLMNKFMHLPWVRARLDALEYRVYRLYAWFHRRGFLLID
jgi:hypothetical protein